jgi:hypothetical protein
LSTLVSRVNRTYKVAPVAVIQSPFAARYPGPKKQSAESSGVIYSYQHL